MGNHQFTQLAFHSALNAFLGGFLLAKRSKLKPDLEEERVPPGTQPARGAHLIHQDTLRAREVALGPPALISGLMHLGLKDAGIPLLLATPHSSLEWALGKLSSESPLPKDLPSQSTEC